MRKLIQKWKNLIYLSHKRSTNLSKMSWYKIYFTSVSYDREDIERDFYDLNVVEYYLLLIIKRYGLRNN